MSRVLLYSTSTRKDKYRSRLLSLQRLARPLPIIDMLQDQARRRLDRILTTDTFHEIIIRI